MRFACGDMRDHIVSYQIDHRPSYWRRRALRQQARLKIDFSEILRSYDFRLLQQYRRKAVVPVRPDSGLTLRLLADQRSRRQLRTRVSSDHLWRLSKGAQEGAAHAVAISKTRLLGDDVHRMAALLPHQAGGLDAKVLEPLCLRLAGSGAGR